VTDSFLRFGWLDVNQSVMHETLYRMEQTYLTILLVSIFLASLGFFSLCSLYLFFVISWPSYDEENDHDLHKTKVTDPALDLYINIRSQWRTYEKKMRHLDVFKDF
jgi:hypothetical protein